MFHEFNKKSCSFLLEFGYGRLTNYKIEQLGPVVCNNLAAIINDESVPHASNNVDCVAARLVEAIVLLPLALIETDMFGEIHFGKSSDLFEARSIEFNHVVSKRYLDTLSFHRSFKGDIIDCIEDKIGNDEIVLFRDKSFIRVERISDDNEDIKLFFDFGVKKEQIN